MFSWLWILLLWIKEAFYGIFRNFARNLTVLGSTLVCLLLFALAFVAGQNMNYIASSFDNKVEIKVDLLESVKVNEHQKWENEIKSLEEVKDVKYISKEEALEKMKVEMGKNADILEVLDKNPLPARFVIKLNNPNDVKIVAKKIESWKIAETVQYGKEFVDKILKATKLVRTFVYVLMISMLLVTLYLIGTFIKTNIEQRKTEIEIKQLTGSGMMTIRMPFILEAMIITAVASFIVYYALLFGYDGAVEQIKSIVPYVPIMNLGSMIDTIFVYLISIGVGIGFFGSVFSTQKFLKKY